jgi:hypothetical protein
MKKIPTLFQRDDATNRRYVTQDVDPACQWVLDGEGTATFKWDGTAVLIDGDGAMWKRREVKPSQTPPVGFRHEETDEVTGKSVGWVRCDLDNPDDQWHWEAYDQPGRLRPGTYELLGPKIQGNPHGYETHVLVSHEAMPFAGPDGDFYAPPPRDYDGLATWMREFAARDARAARGFEGIVWHHPDGRMAKLKAKDLRELAK